MEAERPSGEDFKSTLLYLASHELRAPLAVIRGYLSMAEDGTLDQDQLRRVMPIVVAKVEVMNNLVSEMLATARLEDDRLSLNLERLDLRDLAFETVRMIRPLMHPRQRLTLRLASRTVPVEVDRERIVTILANLIDNAIKYSPSAEPIWVSVTAGRGDAFITVSDHGIGIAPEDIPKLFNRFSRVVNQDSSHISGTGLGLYLSQELARLHGGRISVSSNAGGTKFKLRLPLASSLALVEPEVARAPTP